MISVEYIYHDCFFISTANINIVFDYWKEDATNSSAPTLPGFLKKADRGKPLLVLVSHFHKDHFNKEIFGWKEFFPDIHYIISNDVRKHIRHIIDPSSLYCGPKLTAEQFTVLRPGEQLHTNLYTIEAFDSTDIGNSYMITLPDGKHIFHAGDLNAWTWVDESTKEEVTEARNAFTRIGKKIVETYPEIDICMFPVDARIGTDYAWGAKWILSNSHITRFFAMHYELGTSPEEARMLHLSARDIMAYASSTCPNYYILAPSSVVAIR